MMIITRTNCSSTEKAQIAQMLEEQGLSIRVSESAGRTAFIVPLPPSHEFVATIQELAGVEEIRRTPSYQLVTRDHAPDPTQFDIADITVGPTSLVVIAGPCSVESPEQMIQSARGVADAGASMLRGGAFKPRTSPYSFQGLGERGLELLADAGRRVNLPVVTEVTCSEHVDLVSHYTDVLQIGARNMQNFPLLQVVGECNTPVLLKRSPMASIDEFLCAAEYIAAAGNHRIMLCERGIRTFEPATRNTLDISAVPVLKETTHLPVFIDPSHAAGKREWVPSLAKAAVAAGADGLMIEVHPNPKEALSDGRQSLTIPQFADLMNKIRHLANIEERSTPSPHSPNSGAIVSSSHFSAHDERPRNP
jgi:3-deoxy-7-phosphoheptulonate synthase